ncbi:MAG TPA: C25 family cysteine peptidase, partial [Candidatus Sulfomarinibacteraceae bacterium]|nr:C25 family cysteine peptidase [Candidatus Sulfomarinibacteraceae bacterium]
MLRRLGTVIACLVWTTSATAEQRWIGFDGRTTESEATVEVLRVGTETVELEVVIPGIVVERVDVDSGSYTRLEVPGLGRIGRPGEPMLPALRRFVEIPQGAAATARATVLETAKVNLAAEGVPGTVFPVQLPMPKCDGAEARAWRFSLEPKAYRGVVDHGQPTLTGPVTLRDHRMLLLTVAPATYDVAAGTVELATRLRVTVDIEGGDAEATAAVKSRLASRHFDAFLVDAAVNLNLTEAAGWAYPDAAPVPFLIITPPQFVADLQPFVDYKTSTGYRVTVATTDVTGTTTTAIKSYITGLYNGPNPPVYILMIGDSPTPLATWSQSPGGGGGTDLPYVQMDGDLYPDLMIARWPIDDAAELTNMRDKILFYQQPTAANSAWLDRALFLAGDDYLGNNVTTHEDVIAELMAPPPNSAECELWYGDTQNPTTQQLIADLNTGRGWAVYSAHSGPGGWSGDPPLSSGDMPSFANTNMYPIAHGHSCSSNEWNNYDDVFGEAAVIQPAKGFVAYWGGSASTYWDEDDWLERGFFDAMFDSDMTGNLITLDRQYSNVAACYAGLTEVTLKGGNEEYYWRCYNLNGDPTLDPFTRFPIAMTVGAPPVVPPVADTFTVTVGDAAVGAVPLAMVAVTQDGALLGAGFTDAAGTAVFPIDAPSPGSDLLVRVTAHNHLPTDATTLVAAGSDGVVVLDATLYRCDSTVTINVFDEDLDGSPPFDVTLSASPSGGSIPVQVSSVGVGVVQYQGTAVLGTDLIAAHGDVLTVTYHDANTGAGSPADKTDTAVLDCAGPAISGLEVVGIGATTATVRWTTDEPGTSWAEIQPGGAVVSDGALSVDHELLFEGLEPCTEY